jgi:uncharacterized repeat protein (TIGR01451 family)
VLDPGIFTLVVENVGNGNGDNTAYGVSLVVAVNDPSLLTEVTLIIEGGASVSLVGAPFETGIPTMPCSGSTIPPHGTYPAQFTTVELFDIAPGQSVVIEASVQGESGFELHFDATARGVKQAGRSEKCYDVVNPSGHDVTVRLVAAVDPEPEPECPAVSIEKTAPSTGVILFEVLEYTITVTNTGSCDLTDVVVTEDIPTVDDGAGGTVPAFSVVVDPSPETQTDLAVTWPAIPTMAPSDMATFTVSATFDQPFADGLEIENTACVSAVDMTEPMCDSFEVAVGEEDDETGAGGAGFWCNRIRLVTEQKGNPTYTLEELEALLADVILASDVFTELTIETAQDMLCGSHGSEAEGKLLRQLLALHLNVAAGRIDPETTLEGLCAGDEQLPADVDPTLTVADVITGAEAALLAAAERATLLYWKDIADFINNASLLAEGDGCAETELHGVQLRRSRRMPRR